MTVFLVTFVVLLLAVAGMAIGVICGRQPIQGSCGGLSAIDASLACNACERPCAKRQARLAAQAAQND